MINPVLSDAQFAELRTVLAYVMETELAFFEEELLCYGDEGIDDARSCIGYRAWKLAVELGMSTPQFDLEYSKTAADLN